MRLFIVLQFLIPILARADYFDPSVNRGAVTHTFRSPGGVTEICVQMKPFPGLSYDNTVLKRENKLCSYDFYASDVATCSKNYRTDPGVNIHKIPAGMSREDFEKNECTKRKPTEGKKLGSFRQSLTCDYSPALLAYYAVSQFFYGAGNVQPSVIRTMDLDEHRKITSMGIASTQTNEQKEVHRSWLKYQAIEADVVGFTRRQPKHASQIFTKDQREIYGAIEDDVHGAEKYKGVSIPGGVDAFMRTPFFQALTKLESYDRLAPTLNQESVQTLALAKDMTDMLSLDYLLSQQDRFGNIKSLYFYYYLDPNGHLVVEQKIHAKELKPGGEPTDKQKRAQKQAEDMQARGAILARQAFLKANECAITKDNIVKQHDLLGKVAHMSPVMYQRVLDFRNEIEKPEIQSYFKTEVLLTDEDVKEITSNARSLAQLLHSRCLAGKLRLDLDLDAFLRDGRLPQDTRSQCGNIDL
jgi:hypothetical protein